MNNWRLSFLTLEFYFFPISQYFWGEKSLFYFCKTVFFFCTLFEFKLMLGYEFSHNFLFCILRKSTFCLFLWGLIHLFDFFSVDFLIVLKTCFFEPLKLVLYGGCGKVKTLVLTSNVVTTNVSGAFVSLHIFPSFLKSPHQRETWILDRSWCCFSKFDAKCNGNTLLKRQESQHHFWTRLVR